MVLKVRVRFLIALLAVCISATSHLAQANEPLLLKRHVVVDQNGWQQPVDAAVVLVPGEWRTKSGIDWMRKCSADKIFDTRFVTQSNDGLYGMQLLPGLKFEYFDASFNADAFNALIPAVPGTEGMLEAQNQQSELVQQQQIDAYKRSIAGSNCFWSQAIDARSIVERYVIPRRAPGGVVIAEERLADVEKVLREQLAQSVAVPGFRIWQEAKRIRIRFMNGQVPSEAVFVLIVSGNISEPDPSMVTSTTMHSTYTFPITTRWAPEGELEPMATVFDTIEQSWRFNPRWAAATAKVRENIARIEREGARKRHEIWMETQREISEIQMEGWQQRQDTMDEMHEDFMDYIHEVQPMQDPVSGAEVDMPIHYDDFYVNEDGDYLALDAGQDPGQLYPDHVWTEMEPAK